ncbi:MAG: LicD family protein [Clostridia bacterium]|nr:LicD family protein [Clostridia bacterium]
MPVSVNDNGNRITSFEDKTIAFYSYSLHSSVSAKSLASLMNGLSDSGYKIHLITYGSPAGVDYIDYKTADDVERHVLADLENDGMPSSVSFLRVLGSIPAKTVVLWGTFTKRMYQCYLAAKSLGRAVILYQTSTPFQFVSSGSHNLSIMFANTVKGCDAVVTPCKKDTVLFSGIGSENCRVVPFYFPYDENEVTPLSVENREIIFFSDYTGHNVRNIITAFALIHNNYPDSKMRIILMNPAKSSKSKDKLIEYVEKSGLGDSLTIENYKNPLNALFTAGISITYSNYNHIPVTVIESISKGIPAVLAFDYEYGDCSDNMPAEYVNSFNIQDIYHLFEKFMNKAEREHLSEKARLNLSQKVRSSIIEDWKNLFIEAEKRFENKVTVANTNLTLLSKALPFDCRKTKRFFSEKLSEGYSYAEIFGAMLLKGYSVKNVLDGFKSAGVYSGNGNIALAKKFQFINVIEKSLKKGLSPEEAVKSVKKGIHTGFEITAMLLFSGISPDRIEYILGIPQRKYFNYALSESYYLLNSLYNNEIRIDSRVKKSAINNDISDLYGAMKRFEDHNHYVLKYRNHFFVRKAVIVHKWITSPWDFKTIIEKIVCAPIYARTLLKRKLLLIGKRRLNKRKVTEIDASDIRKIQLLVLMILLELDRICKKYNLTYYLAGGSILGAVRHKGFIPWDDDIDITMPRPDYDRFIEIAQKELSDEYYLDKDCVPFCHNRIEIRGTDFSTYRRNGSVFLDILALEGSPNDIKKRKNHERMCKFWRSCMLEKSNPFPVFDFSTKKKAAHYFSSLILKFVPRWFIKKNWERWAKKYSTEETSDWVCLPASIYSYEQERFPKEYWGEPVYLEFEGMMLPTMSHWEDYLKCHFGDYMKIPPVTERQSHHFIYSYNLGKYADMTVDELEKMFIEKKEKYMNDSLK